MADMISQTKQPFYYPGAQPAPASSQPQAQTPESILKQKPSEGEAFDASWKAILNAPVAPQGSPDAEKPAEEKKDKGFSIFGAAKNFLYGATVGVVKDTLGGAVKHPIKTALCVGAAAAFIAATGGTGAIILGAIGATAGVAGVGIGTAKAVGKYSSGDKQGAEEEFENIGKNTTLTALSVVGVGAAVKASSTATTIASGTKLLEAPAALTPEVGTIAKIGTASPKYELMASSAEAAEFTEVGQAAQASKGIVGTIIDGAKGFFGETKKAVELGAKTQYRVASGLAKGTTQFVKTAKTEGYKPTRLTGLFKENISTETATLAEQMTASGKFSQAEIDAVTGLNNFKVGYNVDFLKSMKQAALDNPALMLHDANKTSFIPV